MPRATYYLDFELSYNAWTNLAADWRAADPLIVERGMEPGGHIAGVGRMTLALHNPDGRYTPGHASARPGFDVGIGVRLRASDGTNTRTLFYGRLASIEAAQSANVPHVRITVEDDIAAAHRRRLEAFPLMLNTAPGDVVGRLVDASFPPPGAFGYWRLGPAQASLLGTSSKLSDASTGRDIDAGQSVFPWVGDTWHGATAYAALRDVAISEGGQFFIAADGTPVFADRHVRSKRVTADATLSSGLADLRIERLRERVANEVAVTVYPRDVGASPEVLWSASTPVRLVEGQPRTVLCPYADPDQQAASVGAQTVITPVPGVDFTATYDAAGLGLDISSQVAVACEAGASAARITLTAAVTVWGLPLYAHHLRLRGTALRAFHPVTAQRIDETSLFAYGHQPLHLDLPLQDDAVAADDRATALLAQRKDPHPWLVVQGEATASASMLAHALAREIGERLHITESALALSAAPCFIDGVRHEIAGGGARHRVTWRTSPAGLHAYWLLGQSGFGELGTASRLGY
jgi:hypothetical protein